MATLTNAGRSLATRTVHIKMHPTPRSFPERREVLRVLERFGEVTMFRSYKYHPTTPISNAFLSLFATESAARDIINASPIRYRLISESSSNPMPTSGSQGQSPEPDEKIFELHISPSTFSHEAHLSSRITNPLHGPYTPMNHNYSYIGASLDRNVPPSLWSAGLKDWESDPVKWRPVNEKSLASEEDSSSGGSGWGENTENVAKFVSRRERKRKEKVTPSIMKGIKAFREERAKQEQVVD